MPAAQIPAAIPAVVEQLKKLPWVTRVILYGSRARGDARPRLDIDLAIEAWEAGPREWAQVLDVVDGARTLLMCDVVRLERMAPDFREEILREGVVLLAR